MERYDDSDRNVLPWWDDWHLYELLSGEPPLAPQHGFYDSKAPGHRCWDMRATKVIEWAWREHGDALVKLWISGWRGGKWCELEEAGKPRTRPPGWWIHCAPEELADGESQEEYLRRHGLLLPEE
jgi:hypothetical protein